MELIILGIVAVIVVVWYFRRIKKLTPNSEEQGYDSISEPAIHEFFDRKEGVLWSTGMVDRKVKIEIERNGQRSVSNVRVQCAYRLRRSVATMSQEEREAARVLFLLHRRNLLAKGRFKKLLFALVWGDGRCEIVDGKWAVGDVRAANQFQLTSSSGILNFEAINANLTRDSAISEIFSTVESVQNRYRGKPAAQGLTERITGGTVFEVPCDSKTAPVTTSDGPDRLFIGNMDGETTPVYYRGEGSLITIAPPGSGKTQCHVLPNLLKWRGSAVVLDVTGELYRKTSKWREDLGGPVFRLDLTDAAESHCYNPLDAVRTHPDFIWEDSKLIAEMLVVNRSEQDPFWDNAAISMLTAVVCYTCLLRDPSERHFDTILDILSQNMWAQFILGSEDQADVRSLQRAAQSLKAMDPKTLSGVTQTALVAVSAWEGGQIPKITTKSDWHPQVLRERKTATIYICLSPATLRTYSGLVRLIIAQHVKALFDMHVDRTAPVVQFFLDELPQLGRMDPVRQALEVGRNKGMRLWMFVQYISQLEDAYGKDIARGMIGACALRAYMNPPLADQTAQQLSNELGEFDAVFDKTRRKVAEPQELAGPTYKDRVIVMATGMGPMRLSKIFADKVPAISRLFGTRSWTRDSHAAEADWTGQ